MQMAAIQEMSYSRLMTSDGTPIPLTGMKVDAKLHDLLSEVTLCQNYKNYEEVSIEAVYTFPLPLDAVILDVQVALGGRVLHGCVVEKKEAEEQYEDAIADGDTAIMLQQAEPGLYTMNVGNLKPQETATIKIRYSMLHRWQGDQLRFHIPTTIAPRYGQPSLEPHQIPGVNLTVEHRFSLQVEVTGLLHNATFKCPSHAVNIARQENRAMVLLADEATAMDRDFILNICKEERSSGAAVYDRDMDGYVLLTSFQPRLSEKKADAGHVFSIVVDCSGSMGGDSILQAKEALRRILDSLRPQEAFNIIAFGSSYKMLSKRINPATPLMLENARRFVDQLDANMGGTEIGTALEAAYQLRDHDNLPQDVLLITDGEVWEGERVIAEAQSSGQRVFTVGVGSSVSEAFVQDLARVSKGACELISPNEEMAERIYRHFNRMRVAHADTVEIKWPGRAGEQIPRNIGAVFSGDTVHVFAHFKDKPEGEVGIRIRLTDHGKWKEKFPVKLMPGNGTEESTSSLARLAAATGLPEIGHEQEATAMAVKYQLMSPWTNFLVVDELPEGERKKELPALRQVPHMLAAGWGGMGTVSMNRDAPMTIVGDESTVNECCHSYASPLRSGFLDTHEQVKGLVLDSRKPMDLQKFIEELCEDCAWVGFDFKSLDSLREHGVPEEIVEELSDQVTESMTEEEAVVAFLYFLTRKMAGMDRNVKRSIRKIYRELCLYEKDLTPISEVAEAMIHLSQ